jgi:hypothetical protein
MRMLKRSTSQSGGASTCLAGAGGWMGGHGSKTVTRTATARRENDNSGSESDARKKKEEWGQPRIGPPYL